MSSETDHPRQRTVAELLAAHGDGAVSGRRARRRAAEEDAPIPAPPAGDAQAAPDEAVVPRGNGGPGLTPRADPLAAPHGNASGAPGATAPGPAGNGTLVGGYAVGAGPAPPGAGGFPTAPRVGRSGGYGNGGAPSPNGFGPTSGYGPGNGAGPAPAPERPAPYANGSGAAPSPFGNGAEPRPAPPSPRRSSGLPDIAAALAPPPDSDAPFVNGGAVHADTETVTYRPAPRPGPPEQADGQSTSGIGERWSPMSADEARSRPTEEMPRLRSDRTAMLDPGKTGPIEVQLPQDDDGGPSTAVGLAPAGAEDWHRERTAHRGRGVDPAAEAADVLDDPPAGLPAEPAHRGRTSSAPSTGQAWAAVVAQWIAGAIGGAALWVGFRFLWRDLPVVALAAAVLVTVGLVLVVRALMRNDDRRTTLFAVLVGLLLTVSPAILVLLGR